MFHFVARQLFFLSDDRFEWEAGQLRLEKPEDDVWMAANVAPRLPFSINGAVTFVCCCGFSELFGFSVFQERS